MEPIFNTDEEKIQEIVDKKVKNEYESKVIEANKATEDANKLAEEYKRKYEVEKKLSINADSGKISDAVSEIKEQKVVQKEEIANCPTCHNHKLNIKGSVAKCIGPDCNNEYELINKNADYKCDGCGVPVKRSESTDNCPFCGGERASKFNWGKLRSRIH